MKKSLLLLFFILVTLCHKAQMRYWVGGSGIWTDITHWSTSPTGPGGSNFPTSVDDVFFTSSSGFTSSNKTITVPSGAALQVKSLSFATGTTSLTLTGPGRLDVNGNLLLEPNMDFTSWTGELHFYPSTSNSTYTISTFNTQFSNSLIKFENNLSGNYIINDVFNFSNQCIINLLNPSNTVIFNQAPKINQVLSILSGSVNLMQGATSYTNSCSTISVSVNAALNSYSTIAAGSISTIGNTNLNAGSTLAGNNYTLTSLTGSGILNITNCRIYFTTQNCSDAEYAFLGSTIATNSTLRFLESANGTPKCFGNSLHKVIVDDCYGADMFVSFNADSVIINRNCQIGTLNIMYLLQYGPNHLFRIPGIPFSGTGTINLLGSSLLKMPGTCDKPIWIQNLTFNFTTSTNTVIADNLRTEYISAYGPSANYNAGPNSIFIPGTTFTGWTINLTTPRTLVWVGPASIYGQWGKSNNWRDLAFDPAAISGPGYIGGTPVCPPTFKDSVIFPNNSYVSVDSSMVIYCDGMNWTGSGVFFALPLNNKKLQVWGGLHFSPGMTNTFNNLIYFKSEHNSMRWITSSNNFFLRDVFFDSNNKQGSWLLKDDFKCKSFINVIAGHLHSGTQICPGDGVAIETNWLKLISGATSLYNSNVYIRGYSLGTSIKSLDVVDSFRINYHKSHLIFQPNSGLPGQITANIGRNKRAYDISVNLPLSGSATGIEFYLPMSNDTLRNLNVNADYKLTLVNSNSVGLSAGLIYKLNNLSVDLTDIGYPSPFAINNSKLITIDSLFFSGNCNFLINVTIRSILKLSPGNTYNLGNATTPTAITIMTATTGPYPYPACPYLPYSQPFNYSGASANLNGTCTKNITINYGQLIASTTSVTSSYALVTSNTVTGIGAPINASNSFFTSTSGWAGTSMIPRKLRWKDVSSASNNNGDWFDPAYWELVVGGTGTQTVIAPSPQCPPTLNDTALFDNTSFSSTNQNVILSSLNAIKVASIYWHAIAPGQSPSFKSVFYQQLEVYDNLSFHKNMKQDFIGTILFRGTPTSSFSVSKIKCDGQFFKNDITFDADVATGKVWSLLDSLSMNAGTMVLIEGKFQTNGFNLNIRSFISTSSSQNRWMDITNSRVFLNSFYPWYIDPSRTLIVKALNSTINIRNCGDAFYGGGHRYNNVNFFIGGRIKTYGSPYVDTFNIVTCKGGSLILGQAIYSPNNYTSLFNNIYHKVIAYDDFIMNDDFFIIDSLVMNSHGNLNGTTRFNNLLHLSANKIYKFGAGKVQWIANRGQVDLTGSTSSGNIQLYSTSTGVPAYIRKDSSYTCTDFISMRDIWAIGNGNNPPNSCSSYMNVLNPTINNSCNTSNPWIVSSCDTITDIASACGPWHRLATTRGRCDFDGGTYADLQGNVFGWVKKPLPPVPTFSLNPLSISRCDGDGNNDSITLSFSGFSPIPFVYSYIKSSSTSTVSTIILVAINSATQLTSYNPSTQAFTDTINVFAPLGIGTDSYKANDLTIDRCFNSMVTGVGSVSVSISPKPEFLAYSKHVLCKGEATGIAAVTIISGGTPSYAFNWGGSLANNDTINVAAGNYTCQITDAKGCKDTVALTVTEPTVALTLSTPSGTAGCGQSNGSLTSSVSGGWSNTYTYLWQSASNASLATTPSYTTGVLAGNYTLTVSDTGLCVIKNYVTITNPGSASITATTINSVSCFGQSNGSISVTITAGASPINTVAWTAPSTYSGSSTSFSNTTLVTNLTVGNYTVVIKDLNNCTTSQILNVPQPVLLNVSVAATSSVACYGGATGSSTLAINGGSLPYTTHWQNNATTTNTVTGYSVGTYSYYVSDANNCSTQIKTVTITQPDFAVSVASSNQTNVLCYGQSNGTATTFIKGGTLTYTYTWLPSSVSYTNNTASGLSAGSYTVIATDANNCSALHVFSITEPNPLTLNIGNTTQAYCGIANGSANSIVTGGTPAYMYNWSTPLNSYTTTAATTNSLYAGTNYLTVTDANGCATQTAVTITNPNAPLITTTATNVLCFGNSTGSIHVNTNGIDTYSYTWSNGTTNSNLTNVVAGSYTVIVKDANNCIASQTATINQPASSLLLTVNSITGANCFGASTGSASISASGGTPGYSYNWQPSNTNTSTLPNAIPGTYTITITDNNGCETYSLITINSAPNLNVSIINTSTPICEQSNGAITINASGGTPAYAYSWSTGSQSPTAIDLTEGTYTVTVSDQNNCTNTIAYHLNCKVEVFIPEIFTPNGDGGNDRFEIKLIKNYPNNTLQIFNRWGSLIYTKHRYNNEWDGRPNVANSLGKELLPRGTYYVVLDFGDGETQPYHGFVHLIY